LSVGQGLSKDFEMDKSPSNFIDFTPTKKMKKYKAKKINFLQNKDDTNWDSADQSPEPSPELALKSLKEKWADEEK
jgi:hypothetical protein